jgi:putative DNA primase/helicase
VGLKIPNKVNFAKGLDTRSNGGLIVAAPSRHSSGNRYEWLEEHSPFDIESADAPKWLLDLMMGIGDKVSQPCSL